MGRGRGGLDEVVFGMLHGKGRPSSTVYEENAVSRFEVSLVFWSCEVEVVKYLCHCTL